MEEPSEGDNLLGSDTFFEDPELPGEGEAQNRQEEFHADWTERYKLARKYLYGGKNVRQDFPQAFTLFLVEAETGNALAVYDLGRMCADGAWVRSRSRDSKGLV